MQPSAGDNEDMVFTHQTSETALSIWLSENALSHCAQFLTAEGWTSPLNFRELRGKDVATIRECGNRRNAVCAKNTPARQHMHARKRGTGGGRANGTLLAGRAPVP